jgi:hypothetical protein
MFKQFLARQMAAEQKKERKVCVCVCTRVCARMLSRCRPSGRATNTTACDVQLKEVEQIMSTTFTPDLCPKSLQLVKNTHQASFLQRVAKDSMKKEHKVPSVFDLLAAAVRYRRRPLIDAVAV